MKATRIVRAIAVAAVSALSVAGASAVIAPADAATRTTVVMVESNAVTSLNSAMPDTNLTVNSTVGYLTGVFFNYYNDKRTLVKNPTFGTYKVTKNGKTDFRTTWTIKKGKVWSDGTPIDGVDMLLNHVLSSSQYSKDAGLGDPCAASWPADAFYSLGYCGQYDEHIVGVPTLSADKLSVTYRYDQFMPDWEIMAGVGLPAHAVTKLAYPTLTNAQAKAKFLTAFQKKDSTVLKAIAKKWGYSADAGESSTSPYNVKTINSATNKLLLVSGGAYQVKSGVANSSITLVANPKYNSGIVPKIKTVVIKFIDNTDAAAAALNNGEIDLFQGQATADAVLNFKNIGRATTVGGTNACYEHVDLRVDGSGDWAGMSAKAKELRKAFLLAFPRDAIVSKLVKPINSKAVVINSLFTLPGEAAYNTIVKSSGVSVYTAGTQATRTAAAKAIMTKYGYSAANKLPVKLLWGQPSNTRRAAESQLIVAEAAKAYFDVNGTGTSGWSGYLGDKSYDASFFAWCPSAVSQTGTNANFLSDGGNNFIGYNGGAAFDANLKSLGALLTPAQITAKYLAAEKTLMKDAVSLPIFQHPQITSYVKTLKGVKPAPLVPNLVWNYWEWHY